MTKELWSVAGMDFDKQAFELARLPVRIVSRRQVGFTDGSDETQWTIEDESGQRWHLNPTSRAAHKRQLDFGRWLDPYIWVRG